MTMVSQVLMSDKKENDHRRPGRHFQLTFAIKSATNKHLTAGKAYVLSPKIRRIPDVPQDQLEPAWSGKIQKALRHEAGGQHDGVDIVVLSPTGGDCTFRLEPEILDHVGQRM